MEHNMNTRLAILPKEVRTIIFNKTPNNDLQTLRETSKHYRRLVDDHKDGPLHNIIKLDEPVSSYMLDFFLVKVFPNMVQDDSLLKKKTLSKLLLCMINAGIYDNFFRVYRLFISDVRFIIYINKFMEEVTIYAVENAIEYGGSDRFKIFQVILNMYGANEYHMHHLCDHIFNLECFTEYYNPENLKVVLGIYRMKLQKDKNIDDDTAPIQDIIFDAAILVSIKHNNTTILDMLHELKFKMINDIDIDDVFWRNDNPDIINEIDSGEICVENFKNTFRWLKKHGYLQKVSPRAMWQGIVFPFIKTKWLTIYRFFKDELELGFGEDIFHKCIYVWCQDEEEEDEEIIYKRTVLQWLMDNGCPHTEADTTKYHEIFG